MPRISSAANTSFWMYYNNSASADQENASGVWDNDYVGVWHFSNSFHKVEMNSYDENALSGNFVSRIFGGVKLGVGGVSRAFREAGQGVVESLQNHK